MFLPIENGTCIEIPDNAFGYIYKCWIPPFGKGYNVVTGKLEDVDVFKRSDDPAEQYWQRQGLPEDYKEKRKREKERQEYDRNYGDPYLESIRKAQWKRRLSGVWFWNNGEPVYLTGMHWMYLEHWRFQGKYNDYRRPDRDTFYVINHNIEDPCCLGTNEIMNRKNGKTSRAGLILYERSSRMEYHHASLQSKGGKDAKEMFKKAIIQPWRKLADFFRPTYDLMKGDDPNDELRFFATSRRGQQAENEEPEEALESWIDYFSADESAADGPEIGTYVSDETSKTPKDVSIIERQNVVRYCTEIGGIFTGYHHYCTTVEIDEDEEENPEFQEMTAMSNPLEKDKNGRTITGLYTYFRPAHHSLFFDKYGEPQIERAIDYLVNTRKNMEENGRLRELSSFKRKQPMTFAEAFSVDGKNALFNPETLNNQLDAIKWRKDLTERGNLEWEQGFEFVIEKEVNGVKELVPNKLNWVPNPLGKYEKVATWFPKEANKVYEQNGYFAPNNNFSYRIGCDPFRYDKTKDKRRSNCAAFAYQMPDPLFKDIHDDMFVLRYVERPESTYDANYAVMKMCWWCGCQALFERNVNHWKDAFSKWNCSGFLMWMPGEVEPGIYTDGKATVIQTLCNYTESYINEHSKKVFFKSLLGKDAGWLGFKVEDTQKYDEAMGAGITLIAVKGRKYIRTTETSRDIEDYLPQNSAA
jgi:hypothetical protein